MVGDEPPVFFNALRVAKSTLSTSDATVSTPPTIAHVLRGQSNVIRTPKPWEDGNVNVRREEMGEGLPCLGVADENGRDLVVEERAGDAAIAVRDVQAVGRVLLRTLVEVALEVRRAVLVRVHLFGVA